MPLRTTVFVVLSAHYEPLLSQFVVVLRPFRTGIKNDEYDPKNTATQRPQSKRAGARRSAGASASATKETEGRSVRTSPQRAPHTITAQKHRTRTRNTLTTTAHRTHTLNTHTHARSHTHGTVVGTRVRVARSPNDLSHATAVTRAGAGCPRASSLTRGNMAAAPRACAEGPSAA